ncbi:MAG TPA: sigma-54 dependent transcriptional regulator [Candidatus Binatia bacterium]|nr:sigma-54 dependent transcriptional regulator [Candidatus Binatia bacterium]
MARLLIVEDEEILAKNVRRTLEKLGHRVDVAPTCADGERLFSELQPDLTLLDLRLPDGNGLDLLGKLRARDASSTVLMMTAHATIEDAVRAIKLGAVDYLQKPLHMDDLRHAVTRALEESRLKTELAYFRGRESSGAALEAIVGDCAAIADLRSRIRRLCSLPPDATPPTVLITGETGTGKGLVARVLHFNGPRAAKPFIEINCAAIPENLVESELFGHERGAFTDARTSKPGLFQAAEGGTLFLDELGCLPLATQVKILKAIEEKTVRPVGSRADRAIDVHVVAATNSDLEEMVRAGTFRQDLYFRLSVARLDVPPLRTRGDDITLLARRFVAEIAGRYRSPARRLAPEAESLIRRYPWPGNVRELRNTLDRAILFCDGDEVDARALSLPALPAETPRVEVAADGQLSVEIPEGGIHFEDLERALLVQALRRSGGSQTGAARLLGMTRDTLRYRLEKFGIDAASVREP